MLFRDTHSRSIGLASAGITLRCAFFGCVGENPDGGSTPGTDSNPSPSPDDGVTNAADAEAGPACTCGVHETCGANNACECAVPWKRGDAGACTVFALPANAETGALALRINARHDCTGGICGGESGFIRTDGVPRSLLLTNSFSPSGFCLGENHYGRTFEVALTSGDRSNICTSTSATFGAMRVGTAHILPIAEGCPAPGSGVPDGTFEETPTKWSSAPRAVELGRYERCPSRPPIGWRSPSLPEEQLARS